MAEVQQVGQDAAKLADASLWTLGDDELIAALQAAHHLEQVAIVLQARLVRQATSRGLPAAQGCRSTAGWLRAVLRLDSPPAAELARRAESWAAQPAVEQAVLDGRTDARQATEVVATVQALPAGLAEIDDVGPARIAEIMQAAQSTMLEMAGRLSPLQLRAVGERILAHVAPEVAERAEQAVLARQEARAHLVRGFTLSAPQDGVVRLSGRLGVEDAATVQAALHPLCAPTSEDTRTAAQRRADALTDVCRLALRTGDLPDSGGEPAQLAVTFSYDPLTAMIGAGHTDAGGRLSARAVRQLACDAGILPVVLGGKGQILDLGRTRRLATPSLRRALAIRDGGCAFPDCDRPPCWTDAHHVVCWLDGGRTCLGNLVLLCRHHHRLIHNKAAGWRVHLDTEDGRPVFTPPPHVDPEQRPRRNLHHLRL